LGVWRPSTLSDDDSPRSSTWSFVNIAGGASGSFNQPGSPPSLSFVRPSVGLLLLYHCSHHGNRLVLHPAHVVFRSSRKNISILNTAGHLRCYITMIGVEWGNISPQEFCLAPIAYIFTVTFLVYTYLIYYVGYQKNNRL